MAKFQVLKYNQITMSWMGIYSKHLATSRKEFFTSISTYIILFCLIVLCIISNGIFVYANFSHFTKVFRSINIFIGGIQGTGMFICIGLNMKKVTQLHLQLQSIVNQGFAFKFFLFSPCSSLFIWSLFLYSFFFQFKVMKFIEFIGKMNNYVENSPRQYLVFTSYRSYQYFLRFSFIPFIRWS